MALVTIHTTVPASKHTTIQQILQYMHRWSSNIIKFTATQPNRLRFTIVQCNKKIEKTMHENTRRCMPMEHNKVRCSTTYTTLRYSIQYEKIYIHRCKHVSRMIAYMFRYIHALHYTTLYYTTVRHTTLHDMAFKLYIPIQTDTSAHMRVSRHTFYRHTWQDTYMIIYTKTLQPSII